MNRSLGEISQPRPEAPPSGIVRGTCEGWCRWARGSGEFWHGAHRRSAGSPGTGRGILQGPPSGFGRVPPRGGVRVCFTRRGGPTAAGRFAPDGPGPRGVDRDGPGVHLRGRPLTGRADGRGVAGGRGIGIDASDHVMAADRRGRVEDSPSSGCIPRTGHRFSQGDIA